MPTHEEHLRAASEIYQLEVGARRDAEANAVRALQDLNAAEQRAGTLAEEKSALEAMKANLEEDLAAAKERIAELEGGQPPPPPPPPVFGSDSPAPAPKTAASWKVVHDAGLTERPRPEDYILAAHDPDRNFVPRADGLGVIFVARQSFNGEIYLRSELMRRKPGTWTAGDSIRKGTPVREPVGREFLHDYEFTLPAGYKPHASNEPGLLGQHWQYQDVRPPVQWQVLDPQLTDDPLILRLVLTCPAAGDLPALSEFRAWKTPLTLGVRHHLRMHVRWSPTLSGFLVLWFDGKEVYRRQGPTCFDHADGLAQHVGQYRPGSKDDPIGDTTESTIHRWLVREAAA